MSDVFDVIDMSSVTDKPVRRGRDEKYPFSKLEVGQGFRLPDGVKIQSMRVLASNRGRTMGRKFAVSVSGYVERVE